VEFSDGRKKVRFTEEKEKPTESNVLKNCSIKVEGAPSSDEERCFNRYDEFEEKYRKITALVGQKIPFRAFVIDTTDGGLDEEDLRRIMYAIIDLFNDAHEPNVLFARFYLRCNGEFELDSDNRKNLEDRFQDRIGFCNFRYVDQHLPSTEFPGFLLPHPTLKWTLSMEVHSGAYFKIKEDQKKAFM